MKPINNNISPSNITASNQGNRPRSEQSSQTHTAAMEHTVSTLGNHLMNSATIKKDRPPFRTSKTSTTELTPILASLLESNEPIHDKRLRSALEHTLEEDTRQLPSTPYHKKDQQLFDNLERGASDARGIKATHDLLSTIKSAKTYDQARLCLEVIFRDIKNFTIKQEATKRLTTLINDGAFDSTPKSIFSLAKLASQNTSLGNIAEQHLSRIAKKGKMDDCIDSIITYASSNCGPTLSSDLKDIYIKLLKELITEGRLKERSDSASISSSNTSDSTSDKKYGEYGYELYNIVCSPRFDLETRVLACIELPQAIKDGAFDISDNALDVMAKNEGNLFGRSVEETAKARIKMLDE